MAFAFTFERIYIYKLKYLCDITDVMDLFCSYAFIHYSDLEVCRKAHDSSQELMYQNRTLVVMYGKKAGAVVNPVQKRQAPASKRMSLYSC